MDTNLIINILKAIALVALGMVIYRIYVSEALKENKLTKKQAYTDPLTGRGNRHLFLAKYAADNVWTPGSAYAG